MQLPAVIESERLLIRPFQSRDLPFFLEFMLDEMATEYLAFTEEQKTEAGARALFWEVLDSKQANNPIIALAIVDKENGVFMGSCGISPLGEKGVYECYYSLLPKYWGMGFATEAAKALVGHFLSLEEVEVVKAFVSPGNPRSIHVAERIGMAPMGEAKHPVSGMEGLVYEMRG
ncbi:MAG: GNAT family N-acetyltransferase [Lewinellaceae bacterium]|nr:GNAT family N-acetyltransferase [Phaeodactylibacter sp.]MCB9349083.1 GNAT family N-acetyltransferase [Lewinellaceae bacterium]